MDEQLHDAMSKEGQPNVLVHGWFAREAQDTLTAGEAKNRLACPQSVVGCRCYPPLGAAYAEKGLGASLVRRTELTSAAAMPSLLTRRGLRPRRIGQIAETYRSASASSR
jgi:hypothetical protein